MTGKKLNLDRGHAKLKIIAFLPILFFLALSVFFGLRFVWAAASPDAIAVRVLPNPDHLSAMRWYRENIKIQGSPQSLMVDGYEAVRDGRTVYVNAANINLNSSCSNGGAACVPTFYTNIYLISYNQAAESATVDIFGQILSHWKFNSNLAVIGQCSGEPSVKCQIDADCPLAKGHCVHTNESDILKAEVIRDTRRLSDMADIKKAFENYKNKNGKYPNLSGGTYLSGKTISVWPSWQGNLSKLLGVNLPSDPINRLGKCKSVDAENTDYNPTTCWNEKDKTFAGATMPDFAMPAGSHIYAADVALNGGRYNVCAVMESGLLTALSSGACASSRTVVHSGASSVNRAPTISCSSFFGRPGQTFSADVVAGDPDNDAIVSWATSSASAWTSWSGGRAPVMQSTSNPNRKKLYSASAGNEGSYEMTFTVRDSRGSSTVKTCSIQISNGGPAINFVTPQTVHVGHGYDLIVMASDPRGSYPLSFSFSGLPTNNVFGVSAPFACSGPVTCNIESGCACNITFPKIEYGSANSFSQIYTVRTTALNNADNQSTSEFSLTVTNEPPTITSPASPINISASTTVPLNITFRATEDPKNMPIAGRLEYQSSNPSGLINLIGNNLAIATSTDNITAYTLNIAGLVKPYYTVSSNAFIANSGVALANASNGFVYRFTAADYYTMAASRDLTINITNNPPGNIIKNGCPHSIRVGSAMDCRIAGLDSEGNISRLQFLGVPQGLSAAATELSAAPKGSIAGSPTLAGRLSNNVPGHTITIRAADEFNAASDYTYPIAINTFCGDRHMETPNDEGTGGPANNGQEQCDCGPTGGNKNNCQPSPSAPNSNMPANPSDTSESGKRYECTAGCAWTNGYLGDGVVQNVYGEQCDFPGHNNGNDKVANGTCGTNQYACSNNGQWTGGCGGDNHADAAFGEYCDGTDLAGQTCVSKGFDGGTLACDATFNFNTYGCFNYINLMGNVKEALTANNISGVSVSLRNKTSGEVVASASTDGNGNFSMPHIPSGNNYKIVISKSGFKDGGIDDLSLVNSGDVQMYMLPLDWAGVAAIILRWNGTPIDADAHLEFGGTHISFENKSLRGSQLDVDNRSDSGVETITIMSVQEDVLYRYYVHDWGTDQGWNTNVKVQVFDSNAILMKEFVAQNRTSDTWDVFSFYPNRGLPSFIIHNSYY